MAQHRSTALHRKFKATVQGLIVGKETQGFKVQSCKARKRAEKKGNTIGSILASIMSLLMLECHRNILDKMHFFAIVQYTSAIPQRSQIARFGELHVRFNLKKKLK